MILRTYFRLSVVTTFFGSVRDPYAQGIGHSVSYPGALIQLDHPTATGEGLVTGSDLAEAWCRGSWIGVVEQRHVLLHEDAVVDTLRLFTDADPQGIGLLVAGTRALVYAQNTVAMAEGVALNAGSSIHPGVDLRIQPLANLSGRAGRIANGDGPGVGLLLLIARGLVDREVALVLTTGPVDVGVIDDGWLSKARRTAKHGDNQQFAIHLIGLP